MKQLIPIAVLLVLSGCATLAPQMGFKEVNEKFSARTGQHLYWNTGTEEDRKVEEEFKKLLFSELHADTAIQIALLNNKELQSTYQSLGIAQAELVHAGLFPNPVFNGEIRFPDGGTNVEFSVVQSFIKIFEIPLRKKMAESEFEAAKLDVIEKALSLAYDVKKTFYEYQASEQLLELSTTALAAFDASKELAVRLHNAGNINDLDLAQEQFNYESLRIENAIHEEKVVTAREELNSLMGLQAEQLNWKASARLPEPETFKEPPDPIEKMAVSSNLALAKAQQRLLTLSSTLSVAEKFRIFGDSEIGLSGTKEAESEWGFGPAFSFPLPVFSQGQAEIFRTNAALQQQYQLTIDLQTKIQSRARALLKRVRSAESRLAGYRKTLLPLQAKLFSETQKQYNAMLVSAFQLLAAKQMQLKTAKDYISTLNAYWLVRTEIESLLSGIMPSIEEEELS